MERLPELLDRDAPIFTISVAAQLAGMHPQTLRQYDRLGLVVPGRTRGRGRRYSPADVARLRLVQHLSQAEGINLPGIRRILALQDELASARAAVDLLTERLQERDAAARGPRLFTADRFGAVNFGRRPAPRAIGSGR